MRPHRVVTAVAYGGLVAAAGGVLALHVLRRDLDPLTRYMSEYAAGPHGWVMAGVFVSLGVASAAVAVLVGRSLSSPRVAVPAAALLLVWGLAMGALAVVPGTPTTPPAVALRHLVLLQVAEAALVGGALLVLLDAVGPRGDPRFAFATAACGTAAGFAHLMTEVLGVVPWVGLAQRVAAVVTVGWLALAAGRAHRWSSGKSGWG